MQLSQLAWVNRILSLKIGKWEWSWMQISRWKLWIGVEPRLSVSSSLLKPPSHDYRWKRAERRKNTIGIVLSWCFSLLTHASCLRRFVFTFSLGAGPVPGLLLSEIFPSQIRAKAMAICMSVHWVLLPFFLLWVVKVYSPLLLYFLATLSTSDESKTSWTF